MTTIGVLRFAIPRTGAKPEGTVEFLVTTKRAIHRLRFDRRTDDTHPAEATEVGVLLREFGERLFPDIPTMSAAEAYARYPELGLFLVKQGIPAEELFRIVPDGQLFASPVPKEELVFVPNYLAGGGGTRPLQAWRIFAGGEHVPIALLEQGRWLANGASVDEVSIVEEWSGSKGKVTIPITNENGQAVRGHPRSEAMEDSFG